MRKFNLLNLVLGCMITLFCANTYRAWSKTYKIIKPVDSTAYIEGIGEKDLQNMGKKEKVFSTFFDTIPEKNLFRPQRTEYKPPPPPPPPPPPVKTNPVERVVIRDKDDIPNLKLKGVVLFDDGRKVAIVEGSYKKYKDIVLIKEQLSGAPTKKVKRVVEEKKIKDRRVYVGDILGDLVVSDILKDRIQLGDEKGFFIEFFLGKDKAEEEEKFVKHTARTGTKIREGLYEDGDTLIFKIEAKETSAGSGKASSSNTSSSQSAPSQSSAPSLFGAQAASRAGKIVTGSRKKVKKRQVLKTQNSSTKENVSGNATKEKNISGN